MSSLNYHSSGQELNYYSSKQEQIYIPYKQNEKKSNTSAFPQIIDNPLIGQIFSTNTDMINPNLIIYTFEIDSSISSNRYPINDNLKTQNLKKKTIITEFKNVDNLLKGCYVDKKIDIKKIENKLGQKIPKKERWLWQDKKTLESVFEGLKSPIVATLYRDDNLDDFIKNL